MNVKLNSDSVNLLLNQESSSASTPAEREILNQAVENLASEKMLKQITSTTASSSLNNSVFALPLEEGTVE